jgi:hypothetical protein
MERIVFRRDVAHVSPELEAALTWPMVRRSKWFEGLLFSHPALDNTLAQILENCDRSQDTSLVFVVGMPGIGKTSLAKNALTDELKIFWKDEIRDGDLPVVFVPAPVSGSKSFSWAEVYKTILELTTPLPPKCSGETDFKF